MKKFLPFIVFVIVFAAVLAGQITYKMFTEKSISSAETSEYQNFEKLFLQATYKDIKGNNVVMSKLDSPVVVYNFWASWCTPCLSEMPSMIALKNKFPKNKIQFLAINTDEDAQLENIEKINKKLKIKDEFIIVPDKESKLVSDFKISAIPVTIIFHRGKVVHLSNGPMDFLAEEFVEKMKEWTMN